MLNNELNDIQSRSFIDLEANQDATCHYEAMKVEGPKLFKEVTRKNQSFADKKKFKSRPSKDKMSERLAISFSYLFIIR